jgi:acyl carrier protein
MTLSRQNAEHRREIRIKASHFGNCLIKPHSAASYGNRVELRVPWHFEADNTLPPCRGGPKDSSGNPFPVHFPSIHQAIDMSENAATYDPALQREVAQLIVESLNLDTPADQIHPDDPLYGDGLGLDSIDVLEVALLVSKKYGLQLRADNDKNHAIFSSLRSLTEYIGAHRKS